jgi:hypothetical protein
MIPARSFLLPIRRHVEWCAAFIARVHKGDDKAAGGAWSCPCRCCQWARERIAL